MYSRDGRTLSASASSILASLPCASVADQTSSSSRLHPVPAEEKYLPAPFAGGELRPGDERYLFDNSGDGKDPVLFKKDETPLQRI